MKILSLKLCGFESFSEETSFQLDRTYNDFVLFGDQNKQLEIFRYILGVLFGFSFEEKEDFRSKDANNRVFTGLLTIELPEGTLLIERDFETDIVASLITKNNKSVSVFQGKDSVSYGEKRAYIHTIRSIFHLTDKQVLYEICTSVTSDDSLTLSSLLEILELLLGQKTKVKKYKELYQAAQSIYNSLFKEGASSAPDNLRLLLQEARQQSRRIKQTMEKLKAESMAFDNIKLKLKKKIALSADSIPENDPKILKKEILLWRELRSKKIVFEDKLKQIRDRQRYLQNVIREKFVIYKKLPDSFEEDIRNYGSLNTELNKAKENLNELRNQINENTVFHSIYKRRRNISLVLFPLLTFGLSYFIFGPYWLFNIPETLFAALLVIFYFGHKMNTLKIQRYHLDVDYHLTQKSIQSLKEKLKATRETSPLVEDADFSETHIERFKEFVNIRKELRQLFEAEHKIEKELNTPLYNKKLPQLIQKYASIIDIERDDLESFLDDLTGNNKNIEELKYIKESRAYAEIDKLASVYKIIIGDFVHLLDKYEIQIGSLVEKSKMQTSLSPSTSA